MKSSPWRKGDRVRLHPREGGDVLDTALAGRVGVIQSIDEDYEGRTHLGVVLEDDPGSDLGTLRKPSHRFFFRPEEVIRLNEQDSAWKRILVAGIGNIFLGDDGFGPEVARRLASRPSAPGLRVVDFGIRSYDLALSLSSGECDVVILVDAAPRGGTVGTLYVIEPESDAFESAPADPHTMNPTGVLKLARTMSELPSRVLLVGCEPATFGGADGHLGLSTPVEAAVNDAVALIEALVNRIQSGDPVGDAQCA